MEINAMSVLAFMCILLAVVIASGCTGQPAMPSCDNGDWSCICARITGEVGCKSYPDCTWTNFHSNDFYCMEQFCMDYDEKECALHSRCMWLLDKNGGNEYCEGAAYFDPERHALVNETG
ncbi:MAG: hypothetical protein NTU57_01790 [Candidatus Aenigmarchaeota archaeon]|nr:hypothetical protein [Candidatus Aenigmarchaeota archaeon]